MADRTGMAMGRLRPVYYLENGSGHLMMLPEEIGEGPTMARKMYEERYRAQGFEWREAATLNEVNRLQERLADQYKREAQRRADVLDASDERHYKRSASDLYQRMISSDCGQVEKDFIRAWLDLRGEKKSKWQSEVQNTISYIWARENDDRTRVEDRMRD